MAFIHLTDTSINESAIVLIDWVYRRKAKPLSIRVALLTNVGESIHLFFPVKSKDAEILRLHFGLPYNPLPYTPDETGYEPQDEQLIHELLKDEDEDEDDMNEEIPF